MKYPTITIGALLALGGCVSIWQGVDIVQVERGWTEVISGATALTGGIITMAIGLLIGTVESLRDGLAAQTPTNRPETKSGETRVEPPAGEPAQETGAPAPVPPFPESTVPSPLSTNEKTPPRPAFAMPEGALDSSQPKTAPIDLLTPLHAIGDSWAREHKNGLHNQRDLHNPIAAPAVTDASPPEPAMTSQNHQLDLGRLNLPEKQTAPEALAKGLPKGGDPHEWLESALADAGEDDPALDWLRTNKSKPVKVGEIHPSRAEAPKPEVVRQYESGGVKYTLHVDGSIEADSPEGHFHFGNMNELKEHLAHRA